MIAKEVFMIGLARTIQKAPKAHRIALLLALDHVRVAGGRLTVIDFVECLEEALAEEIAERLVGLDEEVA